MYLLILEMFTIYLVREHTVKWVQEQFLQLYIWVQCRGRRQKCPSPSFSLEWRWLLSFLLLLLSRVSRVQLCVTASTAAHQAPRSLGFSRQEHRSGLPFPSPMHESEGEVAQSCPTLSNPMDCSLPGSSVRGIFQARVLESGATAIYIIILVWLPLMIVLHNFCLMFHKINNMPLIYATFLVCTPLYILLQRKQ